MQTASDIAGKQGVSAFPTAFYSTAGTEYKEVNIDEENYKCNDRERLGQS